MREKAAKAKAKVNRTRTRAGAKAGGAGEGGGRRLGATRRGADGKSDLAAGEERSLSVEGRPALVSAPMLPEKRDRGPAPPMPVPIATFNV
jgi:hypothetical protein